MVLAFGLATFSERLPKNVLPAKAHYVCLAVLFFRKREECVSPGQLTGRLAFAISAQLRRSRTTGRRGPNSWQTERVM